MEQERKITKVGWGIGNKIFCLQWFWTKFENLTPPPLLISLKKQFVIIYHIFQEVKKKGQISRKFNMVSFYLTHKIFRKMVGVILKKLSKSFGI